MLIDMRGRVDNTPLPPAKVLHPLFEAIINSIHAIADRSFTSGHIEIKVMRDLSQGVLRPEQKSTLPVRGFVISDNGIGFTESNYAAFKTSDTRSKATRGGKGVGRLLWLKAFDKAAVSSVFEEGGIRKKRNFEFTYSEEGVQKHSLSEARDAEIETSVSLIDCKSKYAERCPKVLDAIAKRILQHCLQYFVLHSCPKMTLRDDGTGDIVCLNSLYSELITAKSMPFDVHGHHFSIDHIRAPVGTTETHIIHFCAHQRAVVEQSIMGLIPNLESSLTDPDTNKPFVYAGYVSGDSLDARVSAERLAFDFEKPDRALLPNELTWDSLLAESVRQASQFLNPFTLSAKREKEQRITEYVQTKAPQFRPLVKHKPEALDSIAPHLSEDKLALELYRLDHQYGGELQERYHKILGSLDSPEGFADYRDHFEQFLEEWNEKGISTLAQYVLHRKATLSFLDKRIEKGKDKKYELESAVHEVVFPLRCTSDDVPHERVNLWILDERLAYHYYLASDKYLDTLEPMEIDVHQRPDLLIFGHPFAFTDVDSPAFGSIVVVEFKRPERDDYTEDDNPIDQVLGYVEHLRSGKARDRRGRTIHVPEHLPIQAYIVCDTTSTLERFAKRKDFIPTADRHRYFLYHKTYEAFIEIISFDLMLRSAEQRNAVFFDKLGVKSVSFSHEQTETGVRADDNQASGIEQDDKV